MVPQLFNNLFGKGGGAGPVRRPERGGGCRGNKTVLCIQRIIEYSLSNDAGFGFSLRGRFLVEIGQNLFIASLRSSSNSLFVFPFLPAMLECL